MADTLKPELSQEAKAHAISAKDESDIDSARDAKGKDLPDAEKSAAKAIYNKWQKEGTDSAIAMAAMPENPNLKKPAIEAFAQNVVGLTNPDTLTKDYLTKTLADPEFKRYEELKGTGIAISEIIETGYVEGKHGNLVRPQLETAFKGYPPLAEIYNGLNPGGTSRNKNQEDLLDNFGKKDYFRVKVKEQADQFFKDEKVPPIAEIKQAEDKLITANSELNTNDIQNSDMEREIGNLEARLGLTVGAGDIPDFKALDKNINESFVQIGVKAAAASGKRPGSLEDQAHNAAKAKHEEAKTQKTYAEKLLTKRNELKIKMSEKAGKDQKQKIANAEFEQAKKKRTAAEIALVENAKGLIAEAARALIREKSNNADVDAKEALDKKIAETTDGVQKKLLEDLKTRYDNITGTGKDMKRELKSSDIKADYQRLIKEGPRGVVKQMLIDTGATPADAEQMINNSPNLVTNIQGELSRTLLKKALANGNLSHEQIPIIAESEWGQGLIDKALAENKQMSDMVKKYRQEQGLTGDSKYWAKTHKLKIAKFVLLGLTGLWLLPLIGNVLKA